MSLTSKTNALCACDTIEELRQQRGALITVLHQAQEIYGFLPEKLQEHIAEELSVPLSEVCGVVSFYSYFSMKPRGKYLIRVCLGPFLIVSVPKLSKQFDAISRREASDD
ncbi:MAG: NADH-quinone oxidoreductase subunit NuoE family protein [Dethiobacteraceae bacterium]